jgi:hypothetical protein
LRVADVITAAWDPWAGDTGAAQIALKTNGLSAGLFRRRFLTTQWSHRKMTAPAEPRCPVEWLSRW